MTPQNFVHYLNGAIEINRLENLDTDSFNRLHTTLKSIRIDNSKEGQFCLWLQGVLDLVENNQLNSNQLSKVVEKLTNCLETDIPSHLLKPTHQQFNPPGQSEMVRC